MMDKQRWTKATKALSAALCGVALMSTVSMVRAQGTSGAMDEMGKTSDTRAMATRDQNAQMLHMTLCEEKTEIAALAAQQAAFRKMGGRENLRIAAMFGRWIRDHKKGAPTLERLMRKYGADPAQCKVMKPPVLGDQQKMLNATHVDHEKSVITSQMRHAMTNDRMIKAAMRKRANTARKHLRQMRPFHDTHDHAIDGKLTGAQMGMNGASVTKVAAMCPHCKVKMQGGKCPMCGMTMQQMKKS